MSTLRPGYTKLTVRAEDCHNMLDFDVQHLKQAMALAICPQAKVETFIMTTYQNQQ